MMQVKTLDMIGNDYYYHSELSEKNRIFINIELL